MPCHKKCRYLLWRPLIGNKPKEKEEDTVALFANIFFQPFIYNTDSPNFDSEKETKKRNQVDVKKYNFNKKVIFIYFKHVTTKGIIPFIALSSIH